MMSSHAIDPPEPAIGGDDKLAETVRVSRLFHGFQYTQFRLLTADNGVLSASDWSQQQPALGSSSQFAQAI